MMCPYCNANDDKVIDSRSSDAGRVIRRRRECLTCEKRFTTYERVEQTGRLVVIKKDGRREQFDPAKIVRGLERACGKRPVAESDKADVIRRIEEELSQEYDREVPSDEVGRRVLIHLRELDPVAYIRFASEHLQIGTLSDLQRELEDLQARPPAPRDHPPLFEQ
jgi:transcriptional repressor NrdR